MEKISNWSDYDKMVKKELKGDVVRFEDTLVYRLQEDLDKQKTSVKYYVDILTDLKKWLEEAYDYTNCMTLPHVLNKIKELEEKYHEK
jgi:hypothetical protein